MAVGRAGGLKCSNTHRWSLSTYTLTHMTSGVAVYVHLGICVHDARMPACLCKCVQHHTPLIFLCTASSCLLPEYLTSQNHSLRKQLYQPYFFCFCCFFCFVRIFFFPPGSNREGKKSPHCSIVHIVSFFALEQRLFAAQLGTQWCSHKNEPLSSHTKLQIA